IDIATLPDARAAEPPLTTPVTPARDAGPPAAASPSGTATSGAAPTGAATTGGSGAPTPAPAPAGSTSASSAPAPATASALGAAAGEDRLTVQFTVKAPCWISATVDGQKAIERLLQPGDQRSIEVKRDMVLTAGDAAAIAMTLNGSDARPLGKSGEVVTIR